MKTNTMESVTLHITPLSPVHVGIGEDYEPTNYVMEEEALFAFDSDVANRVLTERQRKDLLEMVSKPTRRAEDMIKQVQDFFYNNRKPLAAASSHFLPVSAGVFDLYQKRVGQSANRESGGKSVVNKLAIQRTFFNPYSQHPIIPGSSIKGAIRTALLDDANDGQGLSEEVHRLKPTQRNQALQKELFKGSFATDPMRLISLGDANYQTPTLFGSEIRFAVDRKKKEVVKDGQIVQSQAEAQNLYQLLECLPALRYRSFGGTLSVQDLQGMTGKGTPAKELRWTVQDIAAACNYFYHRRFVAEMKVLRERRYLHPDWEKLAEAISSGVIFQKMKAGKAFLLRVGRHSGAESVTIEGVRNIKILQGKGQQPKYEPEAKTVWLAANTEKDRGGMLPFGWVLVELDDAPDAELQALLKPWQDKDQQRQEQLQQASGKHSAALQAQQAAIIAESEPEIWAGARIKFNRANGTLTVEKSGKTVNALKPKGEELLNTLPAPVKQKVMSNQFVKVNAYVQDKELMKVESV
ncbi:MAG: RAMP superfamily CRISPR-associated protein [Candidatus Thiothrix putei]|uniref:CRISPR system Cms protein Csm5 n=1 Tax=Candidatus Thiothrix putei TaxID=3080811 RepID=A0AA95KKF2_9GAMM|nr:MAG: RAMP superfamily CRISPR-associated protein [Candidatus Thiothrix putei]